MRTTPATWCWALGGSRSEKFLIHHFSEGGRSGPRKAWPQQKKMNEFINERKKLDPLEFGRSLDSRGLEALMDLGSPLREKAFSDKKNLNLFPIHTTLGS